MRPLIEGACRLIPVRAAVVMLGLALALSLWAAPAAANSKYAAIVIDAKTGEVLFSRKADHRRYPASLTKVMTLYLLFEALEKKEIKLTDKLIASRRAATMPPARLGMKMGNTITVEQAIRALVVRSANDVAVVVAEKLGKTESQFAVKMTKKAKELGLQNTAFRNASGLFHRRQVTTARDMAKLAIRIHNDFPQYYHYFSEKQVRWNRMKWLTHNHLLKNFQGTDGLKTGYVRASGYNLIASVKRGNMHVIGVVMGGRTGRRRDAHMRTILRHQFARLLKRPQYSIPLITRLPDLRPKPDFASIEGTKELLKMAGTMPRPKPFVPESVVFAALLGTSPAASTSGSSGNLSRAGIRALRIIPGRSHSAAAVPQTSGGAVADTVAAANDDPIARLIEEGDGAAPGDEPGLTPPNFTPMPGDGGAAMEPGPGGQGGPVETAPPAPAPRWGVQVGAFTNRDQAETHLNATIRMLPDKLNPDLAALMTGDTESGRIYRARFGPLPEDAAKAICAELYQRGLQCYPLQAADWDDAIRR